MKTKIMMLALLIVALASIQAMPSRTIRGVVSDESGAGMPGVNVMLVGTITGSITDGEGKYDIIVPEKGALQYSFVGYKSQTIPIASSDVINVKMVADTAQLSEVIVTGYAVDHKVEHSGSVTHSNKSKQPASLAAPLQGRVAGIQIGKNRKGEKRFSEEQDLSANPTVSYDKAEPEFNTEEYDGIAENIFHDALRNPLSTFSIDVDAASYSNVRRYINSGQRPPKGAVRIEEMINYFHYDYPQPAGDDPFSINTEIATAPWNPAHKLVSIGLQGRIIPTGNLPPANLVFLIDVSGSMSDENKLPLLKASFKMLVEKMREQDHVAIVVYAGAAGLVLPSTSGASKNVIISALDQLQAGGSTAGGAGIELAYATAKENFKKDGNNRVILATDGDFNVGASSNSAMEDLISERRKDGIFLTVLGFGMGNYKDSKMEILADKGNGNYAYIDSFQEAHKVLVNEFGGTLFTIAKDVKLQVEFNPAKVKAYRLVGYENRVLKNEDFNNDKKDAGDLGSGHTVTALYEIIPVGVDGGIDPTDPLKYQPANTMPSRNTSAEIMTVKFRYKKPDQDVSKLIVHPLLDSQLEIARTSDNFRWSAAVAGFGMVLRESEYVRGFTNEDVLKLARSARGKDEEGYRVEFINLVTSEGLLAKK